MGCTPSKNNTVPSGNNVTAVGSTERNLSRNEVRKKQRTESNHHRHDHDGAERVLPALDSSGKLTEAEIVLRTTHSETTKSMTVGTEEFPIQIEVRHKCLRHSMKVFFLWVIRSPLNAPFRIFPSTKSTPTGPNEDITPTMSLKKTKTTSP